MTRGARETSPELVRARDAYGRRAWEDAYQLFAELDRVSPLPREDLAMFSWAAGLSGRDRELLAILERLYHLLHEDDPPMAARVVFALSQTQWPRRAATRRVPSGRRSRRSAVASIVPTSSAFGTR